MIEALIPSEDVEEIPNLHGRPVKAGHGRRGHLLPVPSRRRDVGVRRVQVPRHTLDVLGALPLHLHTREREEAATVQSNEICSGNGVRVSGGQCGAYRIKGGGGRECGDAARRGGGGSEEVGDEGEREQEGEGQRHGEAEREGPGGGHGGSEGEVSVEEEVWGRGKEDGASAAWAQLFSGGRDGGQPRGAAAVWAPAASGFGGARGRNGEVEPTAQALLFFLGFPALIFNYLCLSSMGNSTKI